MALKIPDDTWALTHKQGHTHKHATKEARLMKRQAGKSCRIIHIYEWIKYPHGSREELPLNMTVKFSSGDMIGLGLREHSGDSGLFFLEASKWPNKPQLLCCDPLREELGGKSGTVAGCCCLMLLG